MKVLRSLRKLGSLPCVMDIQQIWVQMSSKTPIKTPIKKPQIQKPPLMLTPNQKAMSDFKYDASYHSMHLNLIRCNQMTQHKMKRIKILMQRKRIKLVRKGKHLLLRKRWIKVWLMIRQGHQQKIMEIRWIRMMINHALVQISNLCR